MHKRRATPWQHGGIRWGAICWCKVDANIKYHAVRSDHRAYKITTRTFRDNMRPETSLGIFSAEKRHSQLN